MRLTVSGKVDLALASLGHLARSGHSDGKTLARAVGTTPHFLPQVLKPLVAAGWIASAPGPGGGYQLKGNLGDISVLDVIDVVDGGIDMSRCVLRGAPCPTIDECALHSSWLRARSALLTELDATTVETATAASPRRGA